MGNPVLLLRSIKGFSTDHAFVIRQGQSVLIGRSRRCELSLRRVRGYPDECAKATTRELLTVSRRHVRITYRGPGDVLLEDLSRHGTYLDGQRVDKARLADLSSRGHEITLGRFQLYKMELCDQSVLSTRSSLEQSLAS